MVTASARERLGVVNLVLIRCWDDPALREHVRITIGTREQMRHLVLETRAILSERTIS